MFKYGDRIVCINEDLLKYTNNITIGKSYTIVGMSENRKSFLFDSDVHYIILGDDGRQEAFFKDSDFYNSFVELKEYRRQKLEKICLTQEKR